jgi:hypothetical protein
VEAALHLSSPETEVSAAAPAREGKPAAREFWQREWAEHHELMRDRLLAAIRDDRAARAYCHRCRGAVEVQAPDPRTITDAISKWHELAGLRPKPDDGAAVSAPQVTRRLVLPDTQLEGGEAGSKTPSMSPPTPEPQS